MTGRRLLDEDNLIDPGYGLHNPGMVRRREVLRETLDRFERAVPPGKYQSIATDNLDAWSKCPRVSSSSRHAVRVLEGDWGEVTLGLTRDHGECFAVLNMANAFVPGGAYVEGAKAQEENIFRRSDCHFHIGPEEYDPATDRYLPDMTRLISGETGRVYLDTQSPRVCLRGPEDRGRADLGYRWLGEDQIFPFYELRSAANDLRDGSSFSAESMRTRISAQLDTLMDRGIAHVVLGAFGCGAFRNPSESVAGIYREEIEKRRRHFKAIAFAIFNAGYGPGNFEPFNRVFSREVVLA
jgi:hypothetical protein